MKKIFLEYKTPEIANDIFTKSSLPVGTIQSSFSSIMQLLGLVVLFFIILIVAVFVTKWLANLSNINNQNKNISVIETYRINQSKFIQIVKVADKYVAIAVAKDSIEMLVELDPNNIEFEQNKKDLNFVKNMNFGDIQKYFEEKLVNKKNNKGKK